MKKFISIFLVLCMMATLLPTVAFASEGEAETVAPIVAEFLNNPKYDVRTKYAIDEINGKGFTLDAANSTTYKMQNYNDNVQLQVFYSSGGIKDNYYWPTTNHQNLKFTIKIEAEEAGYYSTDFDFTAHNNSAGFMMYVNGVAAGEIDGYVKGANVSEPRSVNLNTVYLKEGENTVSFRMTKMYKRHTDAAGTVENENYDGSLFYPRKLTFTPVDAAPTPVGFTSTLTEAKVGEPVEFTVKPVISDGVDMYFGIYDDNGDEITELPISLSAVNGNVSNLTRTTEGVSGTFTATEAGTATITATTTINGTPYTDTFNVTVTSDEDEEVTLPTISMSVSTDAACAGNLTVNGDTQTEATLTYSAKAGDTVTVVAKDIEGKTFRGWLRGGENGTPVWAENTYTFTAATNVALYAKYTDAPAAGDSEYYDWNGEFLACEEPDTSTLSKYGFSFKEWLDAVVNDITRYVANYDTTNTYKITKPDTVTATVDDKAAADLTAVAHDAKVTLTNDSVVSWYVNGNPVAYGASYTFYATENAAVTIDNEVQEGPIVNLTNPEGDTYILEYNANGKTVIEKGIVFGGDGASVASCSYKVISQRNADFGKLMAENDESSTVVRGYIIYEDGDTYRVVYADIAAE